MKIRGARRKFLKTPLKGIRISVVCVASNSQSPLRGTNSGRNFHVKNSEIKVLCATIWLRFSSFFQINEKAPKRYCKNTSSVNFRPFYPRGGGGFLPYITYILPNGVVILKFLIWNGVSISEPFSRTGYNISNPRKCKFSKQPFEIIQRQIAFKNKVQLTNFLEQSIKNWNGVHSFRANSRTRYKKLAYF